MASVNNGWIKLWRELVAKAIWTQSTPACCKVLITILLIANHAENVWEYKGKKYKCNPGQMITSIESLKRQCGRGITTNNVREALTRLESTGFITNQTTKTGRLITVVNWDKYQGARKNNHKANNNVDTIVDNNVLQDFTTKQTTTIKEEEEEKKDKKKENKKEKIFSDNEEQTDEEKMDWWNSIEDETPEEWKQK